MVEFSPSHIPDPESASSPDKKMSGKAKKSSREAANIGGIAANVIWQREEASARPPVSPAEAFADALRGLGKKTELPDASSATEKPTAPLAPAEFATPTQEKSDQPKVSNETLAEESALSPEEVKLAELSPDESKQALKEYIDVRQQELLAEQSAADVDDAEAAGLSADAAMLNKLQEKMANNPDVDVETASQEAFDETVAELPPEQEAEPDDEQEKTDPASMPASTQAPSQSAGSIPNAPTPPSGNNPNQSPIMPPLPPYGGGPGMPPTPPGGPNAMPGSPNIPPNPMYAVNVAPNVAPSTANVVSLYEARRAARRAETRGLLLGGLVGYFIGRRRGRIKTERRLLPVQERLEKQVSQLHESVANKEYRIREEAAKRAAKTRELAQVNRSHERQMAELQQTKKTETAAVKPELVQKLQVTNIAELAVDRRAEKARLALDPQLKFAGELAGGAALTAAGAVERQPKTIEKTVEATKSQASELAGDRMLQLPSKELIMASETVIVGGESLRTVYESKRISEPGLRRIMIEYARGGSVEKILQQELLNKEMTYERDPRMRKRLSESLSAASERAAKAKGKAGPKLAAQAQKAKAASKKVASQAAHVARKVDNPENPIQQVLVRTWAVVTVLLAIVAVILLVR